MSPKSTILTGMAPGSIPSGEDHFAFPLTAAQRAMWPKGPTTRGDARYNGAFRMNLEGAVDVDLLQRSLREIALRQESFRTTFRVVAAEGAPSRSEVQQVVFPVPNISVEVIDLRSFAEADRAVMVDEMSTQEAQAAFDLVQGAPIRVKLLRTGERQSVFVLTVHQIICDGWSIGVLMEDLAAVYGAFARQQPSPLGPLSFQFGDFVPWQQEHTASSEVQGQLAYWKQKLAGCPQVQVTPDHVSASDLVEAGIVSELLPRDLTDRLREVSQQHDTTFFVVTMAACMVLVSRYSGEQDIALRTPLAGRTRVEFEPIIGQFVNQVAVRAVISDGMRMASFIGRVRESLWEAIANQDAPFGEVLDSLALAESAAIEQPFNINFVCQREYGRNGPSHFEFDGVKLTTMPSKSQGALYDLNFFLVEREIGWRLSLEFKRGLYTQESAESLLLHFREILCQVAATPRVQISALELSATEGLAKRMKSFLASSMDGDAEVVQDATAPEVLAMPGSLAQERFWTLSQLDPSNPAFHVPVVMRLSGKLSAELLEQSFQLLIDRHESLRTTFSEKDGDFLQIIHPSYPAAMERTKLSVSSDAEMASRLASTIHTETLRPFDLTRLPLFRTVLCELGEEDHVLIITLHHILADAASAQVIQRELWTAYESLQLGKEVSLPALTIQYGDFSVWQRENLDSDAMTNHLEFWLGRLAGDLKVLDFPTDRPPAYRPTSKGAVETLLLPAPLTKSLKQLAQANGTTLYVVTLACFAAMLSRGAEAEDLVIGSPVLNRRQETEPLIGPFAGPMALRMNLGGNPTLSQLIESTRDSTLEALDHADLPFELLLRKLTLRTQNERRPLFQFYFLCQTAFVQTRELAGLTVTPQPSISMGTPFEMQLAMIERSEGLRAELEYSADLFDEATVKRWLVYYQTILSEAVGALDRRVGELPAPPFKRTSHLTGHSGQRDPRNMATNKAVAYVAPRDLVEEMVAQVWEGVLGTQSISVHANFFDIGGTSLLILKMVPRINAAFDVVLPVPTIFKAPTIELMANILKKRNTIEKQVVLPLHPTGPRPPLFMIHSYHLYRALPAALGGDQPFYGIMELELSDRHAPYTLKDQVENYVKHIRQVQPKGPYYIAGFCFFGLVAFEVASQLEGQGEKVAFTGLIDTYCPEYWSQQHEAGHEKLPGGGRLRPMTAAPLWHQLRKTSRMALKDKLISHAQFILEKLSNRGKSFVLETRVKIYTYYVSRQIQLPSWLKDPALLTRVGVRRHSPAKIASDLYLFPAEDVPLGPDFDPTLGWGGLTTGNVRTMWIPGDHDDMFKEKNIGSMAKTIRDAMDQAGG
jgi:non-ribosomal peptide synthetase component F/thioesterase domain-containing protein